MRILAVDYGDSRTGIAVSDELMLIAGEAWVINERSMEAVAIAIASEAASRGVGVVVVGHPLNMNGSAGPQAEKSESLARLLRASLPRAESGAEVVLWDERLTTVDAHRILSVAGKRGKRRKENVDAVAASLILEGFLERNKSSL